MAKSEKKKDYIGLRSIRGIGAILIFYHHFGFQSPVTDSFGDFAVSLFFMLSGVVLSMTYQNSISDCNLRIIGRFMKKRLLKTYPVYLLSLLTAILIKGCDYRALPLDLLLLQSWIPLERFYFSGNAVSWFVSTLMFSYFVFIPLQRYLTQRKKSFIKFFGIGILIYFAIVIFIPQPLVKGIIYVNPVMELPTFILGMLIWHFFGSRSLQNRTSNGSIFYIQTISIIAVVIFIYLYRYVDPRFSLASFWWLPNVFLLSVLLMTEGCPSAFNRLLGLKVLRIMGDISFTFYLFHTVVIALYHRLISHSDIEITIFPSSLVCLVITIVVAYLLHYYLEIPLAKKLRAYLTRHVK